MDIDPFGSPVPFLWAALKAVKRDGFLAVTATDTAPLSGVYPEACLRKYMAYVVRTEYHNELGLRALLGYLARLAAQNRFSINVKMAYSEIHYFRVYVTLDMGIERAKETLLKKLGYVHHCKSCSWRYIERGVLPSTVECENCGGKTVAMGPLWVSDLCDEKFCEKVLEEVKKRRYRLARKEEKIVRAVINENKLPPTYYVVDELCEKLGTSSVSPVKLVRKLEEMGYKASRTYLHPKGVKTDAPLEVILKAIKQL